jgi:hypothetical protein
LNRRDPGLRARSSLVEREPNSIEAPPAPGRPIALSESRMGVQMLARRPATAITDPPFHLTVSSLARRGFAIADWVIDSRCLPEGGAVGLNSTGRFPVRTQIRERQSLLPDQDSLFRSLGNSLKKRSDLASFELIQRLD